ncbi:MAG: DUF1016 N-terminal domain-containing protein [Coriobacteriia bacterium]|nr:DUF1016 N-terminal domain-containing protein [Coriobacteriia bacterium]MCL2537513.1 DUF1016 N-terminal domain-containing protein [Coriobacteriia bacterium]
MPDRGERPYPLCHAGPRAGISPLTFRRPKTPCTCAYGTGLKGFSLPNVWRMKQFYETYSMNEKLAAVLREISWTNNLLIMSRAKTDGAREFYLKLAAENNYSSRELERQLNAMVYERTIA